ncbi:MAG: hypothetical protein N4A57_00355 [Anaeromicrobium sp.]|uniref:hypothetical protein n=1 Tax=Anaeromicrobium sp. TaxID=1929132 RepID=UPI0025ED0A08|nr:hypothetical protein [Anaeromicrobium sp.]MCT4592715.1 hypothetical protein [Anaeromicrobium sp.]
MRKVSILSLILVVILSFTGCSKYENRLYSALEKSQKINSMESDTTITFNLDVEDADERDRAQIEETKRAINDSKFSIHNKVKQNDEKTIVNAQMDLDMNVAGTGVNTTIWVKSDTSKKVPLLSEVIKIPTVVSGFLPPEQQGKEYLVYDFNNMMDTNAKSTMDMGKLTSASKEMQSKLRNFARKYVTKFNPGFKMVDYKGKEKIDGRELAKYELKLEDRELKKLVRYMANDFLENEEVLGFIKDYANIMIDASQVSKLEGEDTKADINRDMEEFKNNIPELKEKINKFLDVYDDVQLLGNRGILIEYKINEEGFIVSENGTIDLNIDLEKIEKANRQLKEYDENEEAMVRPDKKGVIKLTINYNSEIYNINKDMDISMPNLTIENTMYMSDLMKPRVYEEPIEIKEEVVIQEPVVVEE